MLLNQNTVEGLCIEKDWTNTCQKDKKKILTSDSRIMDHFDIVFGRFYFLIFQQWTCITSLMIKIIIILFLY